MANLPLLKDIETVSQENRDSDAWNHRRISVEVSVDRRLSI
jgi:hypothetical protein